MQKEKQKNKLPELKKGDKIIVIRRKKIVAGIEIK